MRISRSTLVTALAAACAALAVSPAAAAADGVAEAVHACSHALPQGAAGCDAIQLVNPAANWHGTRADPAGKPAKRPREEEKTTSSGPSGYHPAELQAAYGLETASLNSGGGQTVAIVDAYDDPHAEADLNMYRSQFGLPACTKETGCFSKVNEEGGSTPPSANSSWSEEISLDLDMVSAICPNCHILLVEASSSYMSDLGKAVDTAVAMGATAVSNSWGGAEYTSETSDDSYFAHAGVAITVAAGDSGYAAEYPATSPYVVAVGGTSLTHSSGGWSESVWSGTGAGCSAIELNPGWQPVTSQCARRTVDDTAADANPNTGVSVYDTQGQSGWLVFGGTSVASPIIASVYALAGNAPTFTASGGHSNAARALYGSAALHRIAEGTDLNARRCGTSYLCNAKYSKLSWNGLSEAFSGWYNGPTGNGTPNGTAAF